MNPSIKIERERQTDTRIAKYVGRADRSRNMREREGGREGEEEKGAREREIEKEKQKEREAERQKE